MVLCFISESVTVSHVISSHTVKVQVRLILSHAVIYISQLRFHPDPCLRTSGGHYVLNDPVQIDDDADNPELNKFLDTADNVTEVGAEYNLTENLAITPLVTNNSHVFTYSGSLTTPSASRPALGL